MGTDEQNMKSILQNFNTDWFYKGKKHIEI